MTAPRAVTFASFALVVLLPLGVVAGGPPPAPAAPPLAAAAAMLGPGDFVYQQIDYPGSPKTAVFGINPEGTIVGRYSAGGTWHGFMLQDGAYSEIYYPGSTSTTAYAINARGDVAGIFTDSNSKTHAFVYAEGEFTEITIAGQQNVYAYDISDSGVVVGGYGNVSTRQPWTNFIWRDGNHAPLTLPAVAWAEALGINDRGDIVGHFVRAGDNTNHMIGFLLSKGSFAEWDYPEANAMACFQGIGDAGDVVGHVQLATIVYGTIWRKGQFTATLRVPGASGTYPHDMTPNGIVAGYFMVAGSPHGFIARQIR